MLQDLITSDVMLIDDKTGWLSVCGGTAGKDLKFLLQFLYVCM